ncbi:MAG: RDD family protein, partial [Acidobacteriota bacterium]
SLVLSALLLAAGFAILPIIGPQQTGTGHSAQQLYVLPATSSAFLFFFYVMVAGIYCIGFWSNGRRTLAMKTWGLGFTTVDGRVVDIRGATIRYFAAWIGPAAGIVGFYLFGGWGVAAGLLNYYWGWLDRDGQFLHDRIAGTRIIRR